MSHSRDAPISESVQMYLKEIYLLSRDGEYAKTGELAERLDVSPPSVTEMFGRLEEAGLLEYEKRRGAVLTDDGESRARRLLRKHCRIERFLVEHLGVEEGFHEEACRLEHVMSDDIAERLDRYVDLEADCPDCYDPDRQHCSKLNI
ncbi:metal-dependent transcriptional regulator [Halapricum hydrolyticum]|uniref:Metal-dependent transcriptional regulator n=1 Tax=Halapricum hydrolyticum TaxID=2979991 RepID=A0AAE3LIE8_9EURY|nr:metal-dependent transcriptional regulator [Halapricum hydrolyticum]MCU4718863.1 metal-dependent transcriptional regulator [Halapricum hydrolyticum]MCU4727859.1 metal-dependent transcriptional regulator [Halapricum hydrolyticum]